QSRSLDEIHESMAPPDRGVRATRLRVRRRVGQAFRAPGTTPVRPRVVGATGGGDVASRMLETRPSYDRRLSPSTHARSPEGRHHRRDGAGPQSLPGRAAPAKRFHSHSHPSAKALNTLYFFVF